MQEPLLRATQYLPAIVKLQQEMYQLSHRRLDKNEVAKITIGNYIDSLKQHRGIIWQLNISDFIIPLGVHNENKKNQFQEKLNCVRKAWTLVKERLKDHCKLGTSFIKILIFVTSLFSSCAS